VGWWTWPLAPDPPCERVLAVVGVGCWACPPVPDPIVVAGAVFALLLLLLLFPLVGGCLVVRGPHRGQSAHHPPDKQLLIGVVSGAVLSTSAWGGCGRCSQCAPMIPEQPLMGMVRVLLRCLLLPSCPVGVLSV
jgi:hypothetical protein